MRPSGCHDGCRGRGSLRGCADSRWYRVMGAVTWPSGHSAYGILSKTGHQRINSQYYSGIQHNFNDWSALETHFFTPELYSFAAALLDMRPAVVILQQSQCSHPPPQASS
jgi:hypothetical protein